jgi:hypothetical protein
LRAELAKLAQISSWTQHSATVVEDAFAPM